MESRGAKTHKLQQSVVALNKCVAQGMFSVCNLLSPSTLSLTLSQKTQSSLLQNQYSVHMHVKVLNHHAQRECSAERAPLDLCLIMEMCVVLSLFSLLSIQWHLWINEKVINHH
jgi:hypothetical protein